MKLSGGDEVHGVARLTSYGISLIRVLSVFLLAWFAPRMFLFLAESPVTQRAFGGSPVYKLGLENFSLDLFKGIIPHSADELRVGLVTNQTGIDQKGRRNVEVLAQKGVRVSVIFVPQQNKKGLPEIQAHFDTEQGGGDIPLITISKNSCSYHQQLRDVDVIIFDLQDSGMRHYTHISTLYNLMESAITFDKVVAVLDRPNPLGQRMEGPLVEPELQSFLSLVPVPVRHGMTIGELALYINKFLLHNQVKLHVVPMRNYNRTMGLSGDLDAPLSSNIQNIASCHGYSFLGLLGEVAPFDVGVGTEQAFQCICLPETITFSKKKWYEVHTLLSRLGIESTYYRYFSKRRKMVCKGLKIAIHDINNFSGIDALLAVLHFFTKAGVSLTFSEYFDQAIGTQKVREHVLGFLGKSELEDELNNSTHLFFNQAYSCFMYQPLPHVTDISLT